jgi:hypothetical protein
MASATTTPQPKLIEPLSRWIDSIPYWPSYAASGLLGRRTVRVNLLVPREEEDRVAAVLNIRGWLVSYRMPFQAGTSSGRETKTPALIVATRQYRGYGAGRSLVREVASDLTVAMRDSGAVTSRVFAATLDRLEYPLLPELRPDFSHVPSSDEQPSYSETDQELVRAQVYLEHSATAFWGDLDVARARWRLLVGIRAATLVPLKPIPPRSAWLRTAFRRSRNGRRRPTHLHEDHGLVRSQVSEANSVEGPPETKLRAEWPRDLAYLLLLAGSAVLGFDRPWRSGRDGGVASRLALLIGGLAFFGLLMLAAWFVKLRALQDSELDDHSLTFLMRYGGRRMEPTRKAVQSLFQVGLLGLFPAVGVYGGWLVAGGVQAPPGPLLYGLVTLFILLVCGLLIGAGIVLVRRAPRFRLPAAVVSLVFAVGVVSQIAQLFVYSYLSGVGLPTNAVEVGRWEAFAAAAKPMASLTSILIVLIVCYIIFFQRFPIVLRTILILFSALTALVVWITFLGHAYDQGVRLARGDDVAVSWGTTPHKVCLVASPLEGATGRLPRPMWLLGVKDGMLVLLDPQWAKIASGEDGATRPHPPVVHAATGMAAFIDRVDTPRCQPGQAVSPIP